MNKDGRPSIFKTAAQMQKAVDAYYAKVDHQCDEKCPKGCNIKEPPTITGLAMALDMTTETLRRYGLKDQFCATVINAKQIVEKAVEIRLLFGPQATGPLFWLKNNAGWKDMKETALTGADGGPIETVEIDAKKYAAVRAAMIKDDDC
ncbi:MAG: hypothetical protein KAR40_11080 [Candidatus Sabulitectum sp.]|nr:hypothetical protein [Candidatus Sabulitectum sp.]